MPFQLVERSTFISAPPGACVWGFSYYTRPTGGELISVAQHLRRSDTVDAIFVRCSADNGRSWSEPERVEVGGKRENGTFRRFVFPGHVDPHSGRLLRLQMEATLPHDNPLEGQKFWRLISEVSEDGGQSTLAREVVRQSGAEYSEQYPLPGVELGKNCVQIGANTCAPLTLPDGRVLVPCQISPLDENGELYNPGGGYTYHDAAVLRGAWRDDGGLYWELSERVKGDPARTTRGLIEPTLVRLDDGRVLMVMRGSNDAKPELPGYKWHSFSEDDGRTWSAAQPWTYHDGSPFFSPSSCSQLVQHSSGALLWLGNISPENPQGNGPRYPLVVGLVNHQSGLLERETVTVIADRREEDHPSLQHSNFYAREDRESGELLVHCSPLAVGSEAGWTTDALLYRLRVPAEYSSSRSS